MDFFRENAVLDYFGGTFAGEDETMLLVHGSIAPSLAPSFVERIQRIGQDFSQQHLQDQRLGPNKIEGYTLVLGMRKWELPAFAALRR